MLHYDEFSKAVSDRHCLAYIGLLLNIRITGIALYENILFSLYRDRI